ncbi:MAG: SIS domain-containing protein [Acidimicrobiales bacterium]
MFLYDLEIPTFVSTEIAHQPRYWRQVGEAAGELGRSLPARGARVAVVGCGSSWFVAQVAAAVREGAGHGVTDAFTPTVMPEHRDYDAVVAVSRSGTTSEVLWLLDRLPDGVRRHAVTLDRSSPLTEMVPDAVVLDFVVEAAVVQTASATTEVALFRSLAGHAIGPVADAGEAALERPLPLLQGRSRHVFLAEGWAVGLAHEAALKLREAAGAWSESYPSSEYRHGPRAASDTPTVVWCVGPVDAGVVAEAAAAGASVVPSAGDPLADLIAVQRAAVQLAVDRGRDPDGPPWLARSVVLDPAAPGAGSDEQGVDEPGTPGRASTSTP